MHKIYQLTRHVTPKEVTEEIKRLDPKFKASYYKIYQAMNRLNYQSWNPTLITAIENVAKIKAKEINAYFEEDGN